MARGMPRGSRGSGGSGGRASSAAACRPGSGGRRGRRAGCAQRARWWSWPGRADRVGDRHETAVDEMAADRRRELDRLLDPDLAQALDRFGGEPVGGVLDVAAERAAGLGQATVAVEQSPGSQPPLGFLPVLVTPSTGGLDYLAGDRAGGDVSQRGVESAQALADRGDD